MSGIGDLHLLAQEYLSAVAEALDTIPAFDATLAGAPERQIITTGVPVYDCCDQLAVHALLVSPAATQPGGLAEGKRHRTGMINHVTLNAHFTRCIPVGVTSEMGKYTAPTPAALLAASKQTNADAWAVWNHLFHLQSSGLLLNLCDEVFFDGISAAQSSGGCGGWVAQVRAYLDGYVEVLST